MLLYIGNKLSRTGRTPTFVETFVPKINKEYKIISVSSQRYPLLRLIHMVYTFFRTRKKVNLILIDTYSTLAFYYTLIISNLASYYDIPYIAILHGGDLPSRLNKNKRLTNKVFRKSKINVSPSFYLKQEFENYGFRVRYIPNSIEVDQYKFLLRKRVSAKLFWVRSFHDIYNPVMAVKVVNLLRERYPDVKLCMVGPDVDGSMTRTKVLARQMGILDSIKFTGKLSKEIWTNLSIDYDIFINTTNSDNHPVSVIEAMALGLPVVSTNAGGLPYLLTDKKDALLVEKDDPKAMANAICELIDNSNLAETISILARKKIEKEFDWSQIKSLWIQTIEEAIKK